MKGVRFDRRLRCPAVQARQEIEFEWTFDDVVDDFEGARALWSTEANGVLELEQVDLGGCQIDQLQGIRQVNAGLVSECVRENFGTRCILDGIPLCSTIGCTRRVRFWRWSGSVRRIACGRRAAL